MKPCRNGWVVYVVIYIITIRNNNLDTVIIGTAAIGFIIPHEVDGFDSIRSTNTCKIAAAAFIHQDGIAMYQGITGRNSPSSYGWRVGIQIRINSIGIKSYGAPALRVVAILVVVRSLSYRTGG